MRVSAATIMALPYRTPVEDSAWTVIRWVRVRNDNAEVKLVRRVPGASVIIFEID
jgi:hypothetical protein